MLFRSFIIACSIIYILVLMATGRMYTLTGVVNGAQNDPVLSAEYGADAIKQSDTALFSTLVANAGMTVQVRDSLYKLTEKGVVEVYAGRQSADGIFLTCKNTMFDLWLPLIGYLTFFCGLLNLLSDSNALGKLAEWLTPELLSADMDYNHGS